MTTSFPYLSTSGDVSSSQSTVTLHGLKYRNKQGFSKKKVSIRVREREREKQSYILDTLPTTCASAKRSVRYVVMRCVASLVNVGSNRVVGSRSHSPHS